MQPAAQSYFRTQVSTTSQGDLVVMLFDAAVKFLVTAKVGLANGDMAGKGIAVSRALDILNELSSSLNIEKGGDLAVNLHSLYSFCSNHLVRANLKKDPAMIDEVIKILAGIRGAYAEIAELPEARAAAAETAAGRRAASAGIGLRGPIPVVPAPAGDSGAPARGRAGVAAYKKSALA
ncbi:MAG: flagellar export chaperone FliS [Desulfovibrio sp.]|jgi:flagellar protein FliS|nr:flagellar export chaperone FliS [Desulfovibrio sp.]